MSEQGGKVGRQRKREQVLKDSTRVIFLDCGNFLTFASGLKLFEKVKDKYLVPGGTKQ